MAMEFKHLGDKLRAYRRAAKETLTDASGAIEIEPDQLMLYEKGHERPSAEVLSLMISHFNLADTKATELMSLAGYQLEASVMEVSKLVSAEGAMAQTGEENKKNHIHINLPPDSTVYYTDMVQVMSNQYGVVLHFLQIAPNQQATVVSRIGMSREHAKSLLELLQRNLSET